MVRNTEKASVSFLYIKWILMCMQISTQKIYVGACFFHRYFFLSCHGMNCTKQSSRFLFLQHRLPFLCHLQDVKRYKLGHPKTFHYLNQSNCYELDGVDDSEEYIATRRAMEVVGMSSNEQV